ncbi:antibiotic biosynthesis monooxygenase [Flagellimonas amoyensis]|uniref:antibiotic biosynthesis monooxygenase n=1 Tax=Flagellimonas amoyensis TaxID=2169401 RepID=UPI001901ACE9|nr:antibiotic biosynthesis monooxygenase [Allomuricauda amoyensis]
MKNKVVMGSISILGKSMEEKGATVVISHHIIDGKQDQYEAWLKEIGPLCQKSEGFMDWQIVRPIPNLTFIYTVIIRFNTVSNLKSWMVSHARKELISAVRPLLAKEDSYEINSGLDFLFASQSNKNKPPAKWKQFLITWSAIFPLSIGVPIVLMPLFKELKISEYRYVSSLLVTGLIVFLMVYLIMPNYTKLIKKWLYN